MSLGKNLNILGHLLWRRYCLQHRRFLCFHIVKLYADLAAHLTHGAMPKILVKIDGARRVNVLVFPSQATRAASLTLALVAFGEIE